MELKLGQWVVIGIVTITVLGYIRGIYYNRRQARQAKAWLEEGLQITGSISPGETLPGMPGSGRLEVKRAMPPMKSIEAAYFLAPRGNPLTFFFYILQGRRDELMVWVNYRSAPQEEVEAASPTDRQLQSRLKKADKVLLSVSRGPHGLLIASTQETHAGLTGKIQSFLERYGQHVRRLALRGNRPHLFLRTHLRITRSVPAIEFFSALRELADENNSLPS